MQNIKCIGIGNRIMGDDGIGIKVTEELTPLLNKKSIEVILSETDVYYALYRIKPEDFLIIIDSTYYKIQPGSVTYTPIKELIRIDNLVYTQHQPNLIGALQLYQEDINGYLIGIEVESIEFRNNLSNRLQENLSEICKNVYNIIENLIKIHSHYQNSSEDHG